jgi:hypothetical protein
MKIPGLHRVAVFCVRELSQAGRFPETTQWPGDPPGLAETDFCSIIITRSSQDVSPGGKSRAGRCHSALKCGFSHAWGKEIRVKKKYA